MLAVFVVISSFLGIVVDRVPDVTTYIDLLHVVFTIIILLIFIHAFKNYQLDEIIEPNNKNSFKFILFVVSLVSIISLLLNSYIVYKSFTYVALNSINITEYKNQGMANDLIRIWVSPHLVSIANILSPFGYIALSLHFYFLAKSKLWVSIIFILFALNIPLQGLHGLSRSASAQFILIYVFFYIYIYRGIAKEIRFKINMVALVIMILISVAFGIITEARFSENNYYQIDEDSLVQNKSIYSMLDYFSQWNEKGIVVMGNFSHDKISFAKSSRPLVDRIMNSLGWDVVSYKDIRAATLGSYASSFNGLVVSLLYDFGYIFTFILTLVFFLIVRNVGPRNGKISLSNFLLFGVLVSLPLMFFVGNSMTDLMLNLALIYTLIVRFILRVRV